MRYWGSTKDEGIWRFGFKEGIGDSVQETASGGWILKSKVWFNGKGFGDGFWEAEFHWGI